MEGAGFGYLKDAVATPLLGTNHSFLSELAPLRLPGERRLTWRRSASTRSPGNQPCQRPFEISDFRWEATWEGRLSNFMGPWAGGGKAVIQMANIHGIKMCPL